MQVRVDVRGRDCQRIRRGVMPFSEEELPGEPVLPLENPHETVTSVAASTRKGDGLVDVLTAATSRATSQASLRRDQVSNAVAFLSNPKVAVSMIAFHHINTQMRWFTNAQA